MFRIFERQYYYKTIKSIPNSIRFARRYYDVSENIVGERNRTSLGDQSFGSFPVYAPVTAQNPEVLTCQDNQCNFVGSQMYVSFIISVIIILLCYRG